MSEAWNDEAVPLFSQLLEIDKKRRLPHYAPHDDGSILSLLLGRSRDSSTWFQQRPTKRNAQTTPEIQSLPALCILLAQPAPPMVLYRSRAGQPACRTWHQVSSPSGSCCAVPCRASWLGRLHATSPKQPGRRSSSRTPVLHRNDVPPTPARQ